MSRYCGALIQMHESRRSEGQVVEVLISARAKNIKECQTHHGNEGNSLFWCYHVIEPI